MILNANLECKADRIAPERCQVEKVVTLSADMFGQLKRDPTADYEFISDSLDLLNKKNTEDVTARHCILALDESSDDGILIDPQGYNYARYTAYIPNAKKMMQSGYQCLEDFTSEMESLVEKYIKLALENHEGGKITVTQKEIDSETEDLSETLFFDMLSERPELSEIEYYGGEYTLTLDKKFLSERDRTLYPEEVKAMCARHVLWLLDLEGGEKADFKNRIVSDFDFTGADLSGADFESAKCIGCEFESATLVKGNFKNAEFDNCRFLLSENEGSDFSGAKFKDSDFSSVNACDCDFTDAEFRNTYLFDSCFAGSCLDGTDFGRDELKNVDTEGCSYDRSEWKIKNNSENQMKEDL